MTQKRPTLVVRSIMRSMGHTMIWTNKYKTMRTVKCWGRSDAMDNVLKVTLFAMGIEPKIRRTQRGGGTIVELPL